MIFVAILQLRFLKDPLKIYENFLVFLRFFRHFREHSFVEGEKETMKRLCDSTEFLRKENTLGLNSCYVEGCCVTEDRR